MIKGTFCTRHMKVESHHVSASSLVLALVTNRASLEMGKTWQWEEGDE